MELSVKILFPRSETVMCIQKKNVKTALQDFTAVAVVLQTHIIFMAQLMMLMISDVKCREKGWNAQ